MDEMREKLVSIIQNGAGIRSKAVAIRIADTLVHNGVTVNEPMKPIEHKVEYSAIVVGNARWRKGTTLYKCPKCGNFISRIYDYCFKCCQAFDWEKQPVEENAND